MITTIRGMGMGTTTVYIDIIFLDNILMDFFIMHLSVRLSKTETKIVRVLFGACVGAIYAICVVVLNKTWLTNVLFKLLVCFLMVLIVAGKKTTTDLLKLYGWVIIITMFCGGMLFFIMYLDPSSVKTTSCVISFLSKQLKVKIYGVIASYFVLNWFFEYIFQFKRMQYKSVKVTIRMETQDYQFTALVDSGNLLTHPQKKCPLPIIFIRALGIVPDHIKIQNEFDLIRKVAERSEKDEEPEKFFTVSYKTINQEQAMMPGIFVKKIVIEKENKRLFEADQYPVALTMNKVQSYEACQGIVPSQMLETIK